MQALPKTAAADIADLMAAYSAFVAHTGSDNGFTEWLAGQLAA